jgi:hypothetical protein
VLPDVETGLGIVYESLLLQQRLKISCVQSSVAEHNITTLSGQHGWRLLLLSLEGTTRTFSRYRVYARSKLHCGACLQEIRNWNCSADSDLAV